MTRTLFELHGTQSAGLLAVLVGGISLVLACWGGVQVLGGRRRLGAVALGAAAGPVGLLAVLAVDGLLRASRGEGRAVRTDLLAGLAVAGLSAAWVVPAALAREAGGGWLAAVGVQTSLAVGVVYVATWLALGSGRLAVLLGLRLLAVAGLLAILFKPALLRIPLGGGARPTVLVALDCSASMAVTDAPGGQSRWARLRAMLEPQAERLADRADVLFVPFARTAEVLRLPENLPEATAAGPAGETTDLAAALDAAASAVDPTSRLAVLLVTDGNHNAPSEPLRIARRLGSPLHTVGVGSSEQPDRDRPEVRIVRVEAPLTAAVEHETKLDVTLEVGGQTGGEIQLLADDEAMPAATASYAPDPTGKPVTVSLPWTPGRRGGAVRRLTLRASPLPGEARIDDNQTQLHVLATDPQLRVLYVEGALRPEYKYLRRLLASDPNVQFMGLVRVSGNRFWAQGSIDGQTLGELPSSPARLARFDVVLLGDLNSSTLGPARQELLRQWVRQGGGLAMLGGTQSFGPGGYGGSALEDVLPVLCGPRSVGQVTGEFTPHLTAAGRAHPVFAGIAAFFPGPGGRRASSRVALPPLRGCVAVEGPKSGAAVLAVHPDARSSTGQRVVLAVQNVGEGRTAAMTADTTWQWYLPLRAMGAESPYERFWGQLVRWLAGSDSAGPDEATRAVLRLPRTQYRLGDEALAVRAGVLAGKESAGGQLRAAVEFSDQATGRRELLALSPAGTGGFKGSWKPSRAGTILAKLTVSRDGKTLAEDTLELGVREESRETENVARNAAMLARLAEAGGGRAIDLAELPDLLDELLVEADRRATSATPARKVQPLYSFPLLLVAVVGLLSGEWLLRRRWQMQ